MTNKDTDRKEHSILIDTGPRASEWYVGSLVGLVGGLAVANLAMGLGLGAASVFGAFLGGVTSVTILSAAAIKEHRLDVVSRLNALSGIRVRSAVEDVRMGRRRELAEIRMDVSQLNDEVFGSPRAVRDHRPTPNEAAAEAGDNQ